VNRLDALDIHIPGEAPGVCPCLRCSTPPVRLDTGTETYGAHGWGLTITRPTPRGTLGHPRGWGLTVRTGGAR
jgi:hypothetical protein